MDRIMYGQNNLISDEFNYNLYAALLAVLAVSPLYNTVICIGFSLSPFGADKNGGAF